ncbi:MAG: Gfo/Idh/MocA family oxidoreductase [Pseudomonadota bacterium]
MTARLPEKVRVAVVGAGYFGQFHYDAWSRIPGAEIVAIVVPEPEAAAETAERWGRDAPLPIFADPAEMAAAVAPDIVDITAPPAAHLPVLRAVADQVPWIICQKPFCGGLDGARQAADLAAAAGAQLAVHENVRFQPWYRALAEQLAAGAVGAPFQITFRLRPGDGQGADAYLGRQPYFRQMPRFLVHETAIHWIDTFRFLFGEVTGVFARLVRLNEAIAGEDAGHILFDFADGTRGLFDGNRLADHAAEDRRRTLGEMWIEGAGGTLRLDGEGRIWHRRFGARQEAEIAFDWTDRAFGGDCVFHCTRHIVTAWRGGEAPETEARAYLRNLEIEEAVYRSAAEARWIAV